MIHIIITELLKSQSLIKARIIFCGPLLIILFQVLDIRKILVPISETVSIVTEVGKVFTRLTLHERLQLGEMHTVAFAFH